MFSWVNIFLTTNFQMIGKGFDVDIGFALGTLPERTYLEVFIEASSLNICATLIALNSPNSTEVVLMILGSLKVSFLALFALTMYSLFMAEEFFGRIEFPKAFIAGHGNCEFVGFVGFM